MDLNVIWVTDHISLTIQPHVHDFYQLVYCEKGSGTILIGKDAYPVVPGRGYLIRPMVGHSILPQPLLRLSEVKFTVERPELNDSLHRLPNEFDIDESATLRLTLKEVIKEGLSDTLFAHEATNSALYLFLIRLLRRQKVPAEHQPWRSFYFDTPKRRDAADHSDDDSDLAPVMEFIRQHLSEPITLDELAATAHFEKSHLTARFKYLWGISPMRYVNYLRIEQAKELLASTDKSITEIASSVGFASIHYFSRFFKEKEGVTPNNYRQQRQSSVVPIVRN